jgi:hypothetical protein
MQAALPSPPAFAAAPALAPAAPGPRARAPPSPTPRWPARPWRSAGAPCASGASQEPSPAPWWPCRPSRRQPGCSSLVASATQGRVLLADARARCGPATPSSCWQAAPTAATPRRCPGACSGTWGWRAWRWRCACSTPAA